DDGVYTVKLTVDDGHGGTSTDMLFVTVANVAPTATVTGPATGVRGQERSFNFTASDPSLADQAAPFTYSITWGDGTSSTVSGAAAGTSATHTYTATGTYTVSVRATDQDGAQGPAATQAIQVKAVEMQGNDLVVGGTTGNDRVTLKAADTTGA